MEATEDYEPGPLLGNDTQGTNLSGLYYDEPLYEPPVSLLLLSSNSDNQINQAFVLSRTVSRDSLSLI
jgi:hypothetical protein